MNLDVILVKREMFHLVSHKVLQHLVYIWQVWICLIDLFWFEKAGINCMSCHLYSLTFLCLVCWFSSLSWEIEFGQLCWQSAWVFLRVLLRDRLRHPVWVLETPGLAYEEGKFLEDWLTKLLVIISTAHERSLLIFSLYEEIFPEVMKIMTHN